MVRSLPGRNALMIMGSALAALGLLLLVSPVAVGNAVVRIVALVLVVTGLVQFLQAFRAGRAPQNVFAMALAGVMVVLGVLVWLNPNIGTGLLTALLMGFFLVSGIWKFVMAFRFRPYAAWRWLLVSGVVSLLFVYLLWWQWPVSGAWVIGVLVGLDVLGAGGSMILLALALDKSSSDDSARGADSF